MQCEFVHKSSKILNPGGYVIRNSMELFNLRVKGRVITRPRL